MPPLRRRKRAEWDCTSADPERLANVAPLTPGWPPWPQQPEPEQTSSLSLEEKAAGDTILAAYLRRTADIEQPDDWDSGNRWRDDDKLASLTVDVFDTPADAHVAFLAANDLLRAYGAKYGSVVKAEKVDGLGDEAWRLWAHGNGSQVTYHWRRDNLDLGACPLLRRLPRRGSGRGCRSPSMGRRSTKKRVQHAANSTSVTRWASC